MVVDPEHIRTGDAARPSDGSLQPRLILPIDRYFNSQARAAGPSMARLIRDVMSTQETTELQVVRPIAPEDIRAGMYLAVMHEIQERSLWSFEMYDDCGRKQPRQVLRLPSGSGRPLRVEDVCLPFVVVRKPTDKGGSLHTIDVRRYRCALLPEDYGRRVFEMFSAKQLDEKTPQENATDVETR
jgi:hypothetical protein